MMRLTLDAHLLCYNMNVSMINVLPTECVCFAVYIK